MSLLTQSMILSSTSIEYEFKCKISRLYAQLILDMGRLFISACKLHCFKFERSIAECDAEMIVEVKHVST